MQLKDAIIADRERLGWNQQELAKRVGVSQQSASKWENGKALPRGKQAEALIDALGRESLTAGMLAQGNSPEEIKLRAIITACEEMSRNAARIEALARAMLEK